MKFGKGLAHSTSKSHLIRDERWNVMKSNLVRIKYAKLEQLKARRCKKTRDNNSDEEAGSKTGKGEEHSDDSGTINGEHEKNM